MPLQSETSPAWQPFQSKALPNTLLSASFIPTATTPAQVGQLPEWTMPLKKTSLLSIIIKEMHYRAILLKALGLPQINDPFEQNPLMKFHLEQNPCEKPKPPSSLNRKRRNLWGISPIILSKINQQIPCLIQEIQLTPLNSRYHPLKICDLIRRNKLK